jgi:thiamine biosynthesis protein ThiS
MSVTVNGKTYPLEQPTPLADLLAALGVQAAKKAVEHNGAIIPPSAYAATAVAPGDQIEIIQFVGGG